MDGYTLRRKIFNWSFENPEKSNPTIIALYFYFVELCNKLGWREKFGITANECMSAIGVNNYKTYKKALDQLIEQKLIILHEKSINQYKCNIIGLVNFTEAHTKASPKHIPKYCNK